MKNTLKKEGICKGLNVISLGQRPGKNETVNETMEADRPRKHEYHGLFLQALVNFERVTDSS